MVKCSLSKSTYYCKCNVPKYLIYTDLLKALEQELLEYLTTFAMCHLSYKCCTDLHDVLVGPLVLNVDVISTRVACLFTQTILARHNQSQFINTHCTVHCEWYDVFLIQI